MAEVVRKVSEIGLKSCAWQIKLRNMSKQERGIVMTLTNTYKFAECEMNPTKRTVLRNGTEIQMRDKEFDVLRVLIESAPEICSHDKIIEAVWDGTIVENSSVEKAIANIRNVLNDDARNPRFVRTVRSKGYLFIGDVEKMRESKAVRQNTDRRRSLMLRGIPLVFGGLCLIGIFTALWWKQELIWTRLTQKVIFVDDFSSSEVNRDLWKVTGKTVSVEAGVAKLAVKETENQPKLESVLFSFDRNKPVIIKSRLKVSYSKNLKDKVYFMGYMGITPKTPVFGQVDVHNEYLFGVHYTNHDYESRYPNGDLDFLKVEGFFLFRNCGAPYKKVDYQDGKISGRIEPVWDEWFEQTLICNLSNGEMSYFVNDKLKEVFGMGDILNVMDEDMLRIEVFPTGWWTNHSIEIDYIEVRQ